jgi:hypothetical protein
MTVCSSLYLLAIIVQFANALYHAFLKASTLHNSAFFPRIENINQLVFVMERRIVFSGRRDSNIWILFGSIPDFNELNYIECQI